MQPEEADEAGAAVDGGGGDYPEDEEDTTVDLRPIRRVRSTLCLVLGLKLVAFTLA